MKYRERRGRLAGLLLAAVAMTGVVQAEEPVTPRLTPKLRTLLKQEMVAIQEAMQAIHAAVAKGDHAVIAEKAHAIHNSFILKKSLTMEDKKALKAAVPEAFVRLDRHFHQQAAELAEAAQRENWHQESELFSEMTRSCAACHGRFVADRFPGLEKAAVPLPWTTEDR